jgi:two-component system response regulator DevR
VKSEGRVRVVLVDDHRVVRAGLRAILDEQAAFEVAGEAGAVSEALGLIRAVSPDLVLMDMRLPDGSGAEACRAIKAEWPSLKVVALTSFAEEALVFEAVAAGVDGYLLKDSDDAALVAALLAVANGKQVLSPEAVKLVVGLGQRNAAARTKDPLGALTPRERGMIKLIAEGCTYKEVGARFHIAEKTVRNSMSLMLDKLGLQTRSQLVALYARSSDGPSSRGF